MAKEKMICVFSDKPCRECPLFRGRHYYLCYSPSYRGRLPSDAPCRVRESADESPWYTRLFEQPEEKLRSVDELKSIQDEIDWDFTAWDDAEERYERMAGREPSRDHGRYFFHIDVWGCKAMLCLVDTEGDGATTPLDTDIPQTVLEEAIFNAGGALLMAGHYPIDDEVKRRLREELGVEDRL